MSKIIKHRKLHGLQSEAPYFAQIEHWPALSELLEGVGMNGGRKILFAGALKEMTREWMREPLAKGWTLGKEFVFKHRTATYCAPERPDYAISVKLGSHRESWFPGCEDQVVMCEAWKALESEWSSTALPFLSSPAATGKALLWESLPRDVEFPSLDDDLARLIRGNSPQHRIEMLTPDLPPGWYGVSDPEIFSQCVQYDGRWMYASLCGLDRLPISEPKRVGGFVPYQPGLYDVTVRIPETWNHVGLLPVKGGNLSAGIHWEYPCKPGRAFRAWAFEPELTLAIQGVKKFDMPAWEICEVHDGYAFDKGRPLLGWSAKLIQMRESLQWTEAQYVEAGAAAMAPYRYAAAAIRQILNHTIGAIHKSEYQRETFISDDNYRLWRRENPHLAGGDDVTRVEGGYLVPTFVADNSPLSIFMPHWSASLYSLARARVAEWALRCDPKTLVKIHGDAIYSTIEQPELDKLDTQRLGQPRRK